MAGDSGGNSDRTGFFAPAADLRGKFDAGAALFKRKTAFLAEGRLRDPAVRVGSGRGSVAALAGSAVAAAASAALFAGLGLVDLDVAPFEVLPVELLDGGLHRAAGIHRDEGEAAGAPGLAIRGEVDVGDLPVGAEDGFEGFFGRPEGQVAYIHFHGVQGGSSLGAVSVDCSQERVSGHHRINTRLATLQTWMLPRLEPKSGLSAVFAKKRAAFSGRTRIGQRPEARGRRADSSPRVSEVCCREQKNPDQFENWTRLASKLGGVGEVRG